jgi:hypothetical protein
LVIVDESKRVIKKIDKKTKFSKEDKDDEIIVKAKELISSTHEDKNPYWASVENSLMNAGFNEYIGSWYWTKNKKGFFSQQILKDFSTLGYASNIILILLYIYLYSFAFFLSLGMNFGSIKNLQRRSAKRKQRTIEPTRQSTTKFGGLIAKNF